MTLSEANHPGFETRLEQSPDGKLRGRRRYRGNGKRGLMPRIDRDIRDVRRAMRELKESLEQLVQVQTDTSMDPVARREAHRNALGRTALAERFLDELLDRPQPA